MISANAPEGPVEEVAAGIVAMSRRMRDEPGPDCLISGGEPIVRPWLSDRNWNQMSFILEAEGAILCFVLFLIPGFPKDILSYLFGISPMPFWTFAIVSTLGRIPGTWLASYFGAHVGEHEFIHALVSLALIAAVCLPFYYYRGRILARVLRRARRPRAARRLTDQGPAA